MYILIGDVKFMKGWNSTSRKHIAGINAVDKTKNFCIRSQLSLNFAWFFSAFLVFKLVICILIGDIKFMNGWTGTSRKHNAGGIYYIQN